MNNYMRKANMIPELEGLVDAGSFTVAYLSVLKGKMELLG